MTAELETTEPRDLSTLASETLEQRLGNLIWRYVRRRSQHLARAVVRHLEALCLHPDYDGDPDQRCAYRRLAQHWRWLSQDLGRVAADYGADMDLLSCLLPGPTPDVPPASTPLPARVSAPVAAPEPPRASRRKRWDIPHKYHCPVIGTCLEVSELRRIADRTRLRNDGPPSDDDVDLSFVGDADSNNALSVATHKALERKFAAAVGRFAQVRDADLIALWR